MTQLACPFCGTRELCEFEFHQTLPPLSACPVTRTYERIEQPDMSVEHWQHAGGCRGWLRVRRNPSTGAVMEIHLLGGEA